MKRMVAWVLMLAGLAFAQVPAYSENTVGAGFGIGRGIVLQGSVGLPFSPLGIDTALELEAIVPTSFDGVEVWTLFKATLLPALVVADMPMSVGLGLDASFNTAGSVFGAHLGPIASLEIPGGAISGYLGLGYKATAAVPFLAYGLGVRMYLDPVILEAATSERYALRLSLLYLY